MVCAVGSFKDHVKVNFFKGASLDDPHGLFNAGLEAKQQEPSTFMKATRLMNGLKESNTCRRSLQSESTGSLKGKSKKADST